MKSAIIAVVCYPKWQWRQALPILLMVVMVVFHLAQMDYTVHDAQASTPARTHRTGNQPVVGRLAVICQQHRDGLAPWLFVGYWYVSQQELGGVAAVVPEACTTEFFLPHLTPPFLVPRPQLFVCRMRASVRAFLRSPEPLSPNLPPHLSSPSHYAGKSRTKVPKLALPSGEAQLTEQKTSAVQEDRVDNHQL
ncbi:hypothetical protein EGR_01219 [Echinococcus granulosus]|uniref:Uncharacterized protein n=1 Tax=Echinococcus granulosus TaxID=6210 RepID=W6UTV2_ECHGR|nr:hypothetical protein EGR_01219 [Echinococcus granulosus]EUB64091.1 hypothetical protein EGR_01219 [Echinococcus granulosus]